MFCLLKLPVSARSCVASTNSIIPVVINLLISSHEHLEAASTVHLAFQHDATTAALCYTPDILAAF